MPHGTAPDRDDTNAEATVLEVRQRPLARRRHLRGAGTVLLGGRLVGRSQVQDEVASDVDGSAPGPSSDP